MRLIHVAAEVAPIAKVGGLGDVVYGLSRKTLHRGHPTDVFIPKYDILEYDDIDNLTCLQKDFVSTYDNSQWTNSIWRGKVAGLDIYFLEPHHPSHFFNRGCIYGCNDDIERFLYFSAAALQFIYNRGTYDVVHIHDWQTAIMAPLAVEKRLQKNARVPPFVFTIHNMDYQGRCAPSALSKVGLNIQDYYVPAKMQDSLYPEALNLLRGGIIFSDYITTVSPTYCTEVRGTLGEGLEKLLVSNQAKFCGILNGIDYDYWNPETDKFLHSHYSVREAPKVGTNADTIDRKGSIKKSLRDRLELEQGHRPIVSTITRLVPQKGVDIIKHAIKSVVQKGGQFVLLGSSPIPELDAEFHRLKNEYRDHGHVSLNLQHQEQLAHMIFAGSDIFIVPSNFEPCGLTQMIALRYGTIPLVRATGGLKDSIYDVDNEAANDEKGIGYIFNDPTVEAFDRTLERAITCWYRQPDKWRKMIIKGMNHDFSWDKSAEKYLEVYNKL